MHGVMPGSIAELPEDVASGEERHPCFAKSVMGFTSTKSRISALLEEESDFRSHHKLPSMTLCKYAWNSLRYIASSFSVQKGGAADFDFVRLRHPDRGSMIT